MSQASYCCSLLFSAWGNVVHFWYKRTRLQRPRWSLLQELYQVVVALLYFGPPLSFLWAACCSLFMLLTQLKRRLIVSWILMPTENSSDRSFPGWMSRISELKFALQGCSVLQASESFQKIPHCCFFFCFSDLHKLFPKTLPFDFGRTACSPKAHVFLISSTNTNQKLVELFKIGVGGRSRVIMAVILRGPIAFSILIF